MRFLFIYKQAQLISFYRDPSYDVPDLFSGLSDDIYVIHVSAVSFAASDYLCVIIDRCREEYSYVLRYLIADVDRFTHPLLACLQLFRNIEVIVDRIVFRFHADRVFIIR